MSLNEMTIKSKNGCNSMESNDYNTNTTIKNTISSYIIPINFQ